MTVRRPRGRLGAVGTVALLLLAACSGGDDGEIVYSTTTLDPSATTTLLGAPPARPISLGEFTALLDDAVAAKDPCTLMEIIDFQRPDVTDPDDAIEAYDALAAATSAATAFAPPELSAAWATIVEVTETSWKLLREGAVPASALEQALPR